MLNLLYMCTYVSINVCTVFVRTYVCMYVCMYSMYVFAWMYMVVYVYSLPQPAWFCCPQANDTFAGDYLLQSFQRLAMILANKSEGVESYQRDNFGGDSHTCSVCVFNLSSVDNEVILHVTLIFLIFQ